ncbi:hypothetical protein [Leptolyngbya sp. BC1307]|uniref:hypothetical protein n=1 Tax=Leptolyngbya sp. BC1307 TaxID=2029589 RepID=UPI001F0B49F6|nr:hypothetical protein [Leptolyngbya sp. BC1307]
MSSASSVAATLRPETRQQIAIEALAKSKPISHLATKYQVSRKFVYDQSDQAKQSLDESFEPTAPDEQILFHLPITKAWLFQLIFGLVLICHSSLRGVVELLRASLTWLSVPVRFATVSIPQQSKPVRSMRLKTCRRLK